jgi:hypothetical protein
VVFPALLRKCGTRLIAAADAREPKFDDCVAIEPFESGEIDANGVSQATLRAAITANPWTAEGRDRAVLCRRDIIDGINNESPMIANSRNPVRAVCVAATVQSVGIYTCPVQRGRL